MDFSSISVLFNFALLVGVLYFSTRKSFGEFLRQRHTGIKKEIDEASQLAESSSQHLHHYTVAFGNKEKEIEEQKTDFSQRLLNLRSEVSARVKKDIERIMKEAELQGSSETLKQRDRIEKLILKKSLAQAKAYLKENMKEEEESFFFQKFLKTTLKTKEASQASASGA